MPHFILITGASTGIGLHATSLYIRHGYSVLAGVRSAQDAERLSKSFGDQVIPLMMDVTKEDEVLEAVREAEKHIGEHPLVAIINNAGIVISGAVLYIPLDEWRRQFEVNVLGSVRVTQHFFPLLKKTHANDSHPKRIINMSSVSGLFASPFLGPYAASKYALEAVSDSLRRELFMYDIQVVLIEPGNIQHAHLEKAKTRSCVHGPGIQGHTELQK